MKIVSKAFDVVETALKYICMMITVAFTLITFASVIARYVFKAPFDWSEQTCRYLFIWSIMLYMPVIMRKRGNLGFDLLLNRLPKTARDWIILFCHVLIAGFALFYFDYTMVFIQKTMNKKFSGLNLPYWTIYGAQAVGAAILFLFTLELIVCDAGDLIRKRKEG